jgi:hypothetical protein
VGVHGAMESEYDVSLNDGDDMSTVVGSLSDGAVSWIKERAEAFFRTAVGAAAAKLSAFLDSDEASMTIQGFVSGSDPKQRVLFFFELGGGRFYVTTRGVEVELAQGRAAMYVARAPARDVTSAASQYIIGDLSDALQQLEKVTRSVFLPLITRANAQRVWPEVVGSETTATLRSLLASAQVTIGQTNGNTCLPLPVEASGAEPLDLLGHTDAREASDTDSVSSPLALSSVQERIHMFEGCVVTWVRDARVPCGRACAVEPRVVRRCVSVPVFASQTKQIKAVLRQDPERLFEQASYPGPLLEVDFWVAKARNLNSIFTQLQVRSAAPSLAYMR